MSNLLLCKSIYLLALLHILLLMTSIILQLTVLFYLDFD